MISKSLFVEFHSSPKLAWWHYNDRETYERIIDLRSGGAHRTGAGQVVEDMALRLFTHQPVYKIPVPDRQDDTWYSEYAEVTSRAMRDHPGEVLYQPAFLYEDLFCIADLLLPEDEGGYTCVEVKSKHAVRSGKKRRLNGKIARDIGFQSYVIRHAIGTAFSGKSMLCYLNQAFRKSGPVDPSDVLLLEEVTNEIPGNRAIQQQLVKMHADLPLPEADFNARHPFNGSRFDTFFGEPPPSGSIWRVPGQTTGLWKSFGHKNMAILDITDKDLNRLIVEESISADQAEYIRRYKDGLRSIDRSALRQELEKLRFPLVFYDYETISSPIPLLDGARPWEQVMVQYSMHILEEMPETIPEEGLSHLCRHTEGLIEPGARHNKVVVSSLIQDITGVRGHFIVWNKHFEKACNRNMAATHPEFAQELYRMNAHTYDLMDIFSKQIFFDRRFEGSSSLKMVLPVITEMDYSDLEIQDGSMATQTLEALLKDEIPAEELPSVRRQLLAYCERDSLAMVLIFEELYRALEDQS